MRVGQILFINDMCCVHACGVTTKPVFILAPQFQINAPIESTLDGSRHMASQMGAQRPIPMISVFSFDAFGTDMGA